MTEPRTYTEGELEDVVNKRLKERREIINEAVDALRPDLDAMRREISAANHVKKEIGVQLKSLSREVRKANLELKAHAALSSHPGTEAELQGIREELEEGAQVMEEFGITQLSAEQKKAFPAVLKDAVRTKDERLEDDRKEARRQNRIHAASAFIAALAGVVSATIAAHLWK